MMFGFCGLGGRRGGIDGCKSFGGCGGYGGERMDVGC